MIFLKGCREVFEKWVGESLKAPSKSRKSPTDLDHKKALGEKAKIWKCDIKKHPWPLSSKNATEILKSCLDLENNRPQKSTNHILKKLLDLQKVTPQS